MKCRGQSRKDTPAPTRLLTAKNISRVGTWNVRTMFESGRTAQVAKEFTNYGLEILGLCETRWNSFGQLRLQSGETLLYSGHQDEEAEHTAGVGLMLSRKATNSLISWEPISERLMTATFRTQVKNINLTIIQGYAPTNQGTPEEKTDFYNKLQEAKDKLRRKDVSIVMGDYNAKIGDDNTGLEDIMGKEGIGELNENGELFTDWCAENEMMIGGSLFPHKNIHKPTWISPDGKTENQIDHICIGKRHRPSLQDVRAYRGADVGTDHHLLIAKMKLALRRKAPPTAHRARYDVGQLDEDNRRKEFTLALRNRFEALYDNQEPISINEEWTIFKEAITSTCKEVLGSKPRQHKPWITTTTLNMINERKEAKTRVNTSRTRAGKGKALQTYNEIHKRVKTRIKEDKRNFYDKLAQEAEDAVGCGNIRQLYQTTKLMCGKFRQTDKPVKDKEGNLLTNTEDQKKRWKEHFSELLNRPQPTHPPTIEPAGEDLPINVDIPTRTEIADALKKIKAGKAAGPDGIPGEALKHTPEACVCRLDHLFARIWEEETFPPDWKEGNIVKLPKKGDLQNCGNYRGIMLLSIPGKVFTRIILQRIKDAIDTALRDEQAGFRKGRSCSDQIATLRIILEQSLEWNSPLYVNFIDYEKAFDSVHRSSIWKLLRHYGIPKKIVNLIEQLYEGSKAAVIHGGETTEHFDIVTGVRQGCLLSPLLFLLAINWIMENSTKDKRNGIQWSFTRQLEDLDFADDIALLSHSHKQMQDKTNSIDAISQQIGLNINLQKTKVLRNESAKSTQPILLRSNPVEDVDKFCYLGSIVDKQGGVQEDIRSRINKARQAFGALNKVWNSGTLRKRTKIRIFNSNVKSVLLYGSETWRLTKESLNKLQSFTNRCLRRILRIRWYDMVTNQELHDRTQQDPIEKELVRRKWRWIGHTLRKDPSSTTRSSLRWNPQGTRSRGRPRNTWRREVENEMARIGKTWKELEMMAQDRGTWRTFVEDLCSTGG